MSLFLLAVHRVIVPGFDVFNERHLRLHQPLFER